MDVNKAKVQEDIVRLYLRLNGYFVTGFIVHSPVPGRNRTEIDALAIRMPYSAEPERVIEPDNLLALSSNYIDLVICEVKSRRQPIRFNEALYDDGAINAVLRWAGPFRDEELPELANKLREVLTQTPLPSSGPPCVIGPRGVRVRCLFFSIEREKKQRNQPWFITGPDVFDYIHRCLSPAPARDLCSTTYDFGLWGDKGDIVKYFKNRQDAGDIEQLYCYLEGLPSTPDSSLRSE